jgi:hypothetical protein
MNWMEVDRILIAPLGFFLLPLSPELFHLVLNESPISQNEAAPESSVHIGILRSLCQEMKLHLCNINILFITAQLPHLIMKLI